MTMWLVRAGKVGEREKLALETSTAIIGWKELPDLSPCTTRDALRALMQSVYPDQKPKILMNWESQVWPFRETISVGDLIVLPLKTRADIAVGRIKGAYQYRTDLSPTPLHTRPVEWLKEFPRSAFDKDLLFSFGAFMTICRISRHEAEQRVEAKLQGSKWSPKTVQTTTPNPQEPPLAGPSDKTDETALPDIEEQSQDLIRERIAQRFKGHGLATLTAAVLQAQG